MVRYERSWSRVQGSLRKVMKIREVHTKVKKSHLSTYIIPALKLCAIVYSRQCWRVKVEIESSSNLYALD